MQNDSSLIGSSPSYLADPVVSSDQSAQLPGVLPAWQIPQLRNNGKVWQ